MDWAQFATFLITNIIFTLILWLWNRSENRSDLRHMDSKLETTRELVKAIYDEIKDFHNRLCDIERNRGK